MSGIEYIPLHCLSPADCLNLLIHCHITTLLSMLLYVYFCNGQDDWIVHEVNLLITIITSIDCYRDRNTLVIRTCLMMLFTQWQH